MWDVIVSVPVHCLSFYFDLLFNLFRITLWPSVRKELSPWLFTCAVFYFSAVLLVSVPLPFGLGQDLEFDCIGSWLLLFEVVWNMRSGHSSSWSLPFCISKAKLAFSSLMYGNKEVLLHRHFNVTEYCLLGSLVTYTKDINTNKIRVPKSDNQTLTKQI